MKPIRKVTLLIVTVFLCITSLTWATERTLRTYITGISGAALKNVQARLAGIQSSYPDDLTDYDIREFLKMRLLIFKIR